jgi:hypothetical protein
VSLANALVEELTEDRPLAIAHHLESLKVAGRIDRWRAIAREELQQMNTGLATVR